MPMTNDIVIILRPKKDADERDVWAGIRWLLKTALRRFDLRCVSVKENGTEVTGTSWPKP
ncbi:MAG: hypothetical protein IID41_00435 [Planctomycetes bacterium]|nr:hypothetical protein [Planctomycetota bacterium]